jgi:hypothetical protein
MPELVASRSDKAPGAVGTIFRPHARYRRRHDYLVRQRSSRRGLLRSGAN